MSLKKGTEIPTIDVVLVTIITDEEVPQQYALDTASKIGVEPQIEKQEAVKLIVKSVLKAQKKEKSVITGHKLTLTDNVFIPEIVKILQGGTIQTQEVPVDGTGTQQVETATVAGTISTAGNATVVVSSNLFDADETLSVVVSLNDTAAQVAAKIRAALALNAVVAAAFTIGGTGVYIVLTAKEAAANDATLNISVDNGTCAGITTATTSANTTAGIAPDMEDEVIGYTPPVAGQVNELTPFTLAAYSAQYNEAGQIVRYERITYPNCTGEPVALNTEDGVFRVGEYMIDSAPEKGQAPYAIAYVSELPAVS